MIKHNSLVLEKDKSLGFPVKYKEFIMNPFGWRSEEDEAAHDALAQRLEPDDDDDDDDKSPPRRSEPDDDHYDDEIKSDGGPGRGNW